MAWISDLIKASLSRLAAPLSSLMLLTALALSGCGGDATPATPATPTAIAVQPASTSVVTGSEADFSVSATGDGLAYQWQSSTDAGTTWANIAAATASHYVLSAVDATFNGIEYRVVVTGAAGSVTSSSVTLTVTGSAAGPAITTQPADQSATVGASASFSVTATGTSLSYQWQASADGTTWTDIAGATSATLTLASVALTDDGKHVHVVVTNATSSVTSNAATLSVHAATAMPVIDTQPSPASVVAPQTATFSVVASGNPTPSYQWQKSTDGGTTYTDIALATAATFTTQATTVADSGTLLRVRVTNSVGSVLSNGVALTVSAATSAPGFSVQPLAVSVTAPQPATFSATATGSPTPTLQWQSSTDGGATFVNINGATSASYTTPATTTADSGKRFRVVATNSSGSLASTSVTLTVNAPAGGGGSGDSAACAPWAMPVGTTVQTTYSDPGSPQLSGTQTTRNDGLVLFSGHDATELATTNTFAGAEIDAKLYASFDAASGVATLYGSVSHEAVTSGASTTAQDATSVLTPPVVDNEFTLAAGQSVAAQTEVSSVTSTLTLNGVVGAPTTSTSTTTVPGTTFVGMETVTVAAGTFSTCRYLSTTGVTQWLLPVYGLPVQNSQGQFATAILVNGVAFTHN